VIEEAGVAPSRALLGGGLHAGVDGRRVREPDLKEHVERVRQDVQIAFEDGQVLPHPVEPPQEQRPIARVPIEVLRERGLDD